MDFPPAATGSKVRRKRLSDEASTSFFDHVQTGMRNIVVLDGIVFSVRKRANENRVVLGRDECDCVDDLATHWPFCHETRHSHL